MSLLTSKLWILSSREERARMMDTGDVVMENNYIAFENGKWRYMFIRGSRPEWIAHAEKNLSYLALDSIADTMVEIKRAANETIQENSRINFSSLSAERLWRRSTQNICTLVHEEATERGAIVSSTDLLLCPLKFAFLLGWYTLTMRKIIQKRFISERSKLWKTDGSQRLRKTMWQAWEERTVFCN